MRTRSKSLECSSAGDTRFSAYYARIQLPHAGKLRTKTIEEWYQLSKRFGKIRPWVVKDAKGKAPTHLVINGQRYPAHFLSQWYKLLWLKYLDDNPELVKFASQFDEFTDQFRGKRTTNCQADVIKQYVKRGRQSLIDDCEYLIDEMKGWDLFMATKPTTDLPKVFAWTDGACKGNGSKNAAGGWAYIVQHDNGTGIDERSRSLGVVYKGVTNNQMELRAVIEVFKRLKCPCHITIESDSEYVTKPFSTGSLKDWMSNGWRTKDGSPVANQPLWKELVKAIKDGGHRVKMKWVKGHDKNEMNNRVDKMAQQAAEQAKAAA